MEFQLMLMESTAKQRTILMDFGGKRFILEAEHSEITEMISFGVITPIEEDPNVPKGVTHMSQVFTLNT